MQKSAHDRKRAAFGTLSAYVIMDGANVAGTIAFKYGAEARCFLHIVGAPTVTGTARGYGYDKETACAEAAAAHLIGADADTDDAPRIDRAKFALQNEAKSSWEGRLRAAGFNVVQAA